MYTKKEMHQILCESAIYVDNGIEDDNGRKVYGGSYRIDYVPEWELWESGEESMILTDEETYEDHYLWAIDIDLNDPEVHTYKLVLSNPIKE